MGRTNTKARHQRHNLNDLQIESAVPGIFTNDASGSGQGAILNQDFTRNSPSNPAKKGTAAAIYATGLGSVSPAVSDGTLTGGTLSWHTQPVHAAVDGFSADVTYAGTAPELVFGGSQVNVVIPASARSGSMPVVIYVGSGVEPYSQANVTVAVQ